MILKEKKFFYINEILERMGENIKLDINKSVSYLRLCYILGKCSLWRVMWAYLKEPPLRSKTILFLIKILKLRYMK